MSNRARRRGALAIAALTVLLAGCAEGTRGPAASAPPVSTPAASAPAGFPLTIDSCGRKLTFAAPPSRVYLGFQTTAEIVVGLGQADRAIGQVNLLVPPPPEMAEAFKKIPDVSAGDGYTPAAREQMLSLRPDLQVAFFDFEFGGTDDSAPGLATIQDMAAIGAQVYSSLCRNAQNKNEESVAAAYRAIGDLGRIFGVPDRAAAHLAQMKQRIADVQAKIAGRKPVPVLYYNGGKGPIGTVGGKSFINEMIGLAGGVNVFGDTTEGRSENYFKAPLERVAATSPALFLINTKQDPGSPDGNANAAYLYQTFPNMPASRDRRVLFTDYIAPSAGWRFDQFVEDLARALHPDAFGS